MKGRRLSILGCRGIPAAHGGFETFAEYLALHLQRRGWEVTVYCQVDGEGGISEDEWRGVRRVIVPVRRSGPLGTIVFDWKCIRHAAREQGLVLTLGYNTAVFSAWLRMKGVTNLINMDGIEWRRAKWPWLVRVWFWMNERLGCWLGNHLVADNPGIEAHLATRVSRENITMIPYGAPRIDGADAALLAPYGLVPGRFATLIARAEPENSILEVVRAFSRRERGIKLVVLGKYDRGHAYQRRVLEAASDEVVFPGAVYDKAVLAALRFHSLFYVHGHQVGGTNPSLVEALGAGNAVLAYDNVFNRWVAGEAAVYFRGEDECAQWIDRLAAEGTPAHPHPGPLPSSDGEVLAGGGSGEAPPDAYPGALLATETRIPASAGMTLIGRLRTASRARHAEALTWDRVLGEYEQLLGRWAAVAAEKARAPA
jgi:glycosyltransferase involved in cell wall biosynthesis